jgi:hypothetical protein
MSEYNIISWDVILQNNERLPIIYVKPDLNFMDLIHKSSNVIVEISGTNTKYDNNKMRGVVNQSSYFPNCRPNFFLKNGLYVITLGSAWLGYPHNDMSGKVKIYSNLY